MDQKLKQEFEKLNQRLDVLPTKTDLNNAVDHLVAVINETIAEPMERQLANINDAINIRTEVELLKTDMQKIKTALHLT